MQAVNLLMRWLHIFSVITAVGATVFMRFVVVPSLADVTNEARAEFLKSMSVKLKILIHSAIGGILLSGLYNTHLLWRSSVTPYGFIYALKMILALIIFMVAIFLTSSNPKRAAFQANRKKWLAVNVGLAVVVVLLSAILRSLHR